MWIPAPERPTEEARARARQAAVGPAHTFPLLAARLQQALSQRPTPLKTYQRFHLTIEIAFMIVMALFLETRRFWIYLPGFAALLGGSLITGYWLLLTPLLALILVHLFIRKLTDEAKDRRK